MNLGCRLGHHRDLEADDFVVPEDEAFDVGLRNLEPRGSWLTGRKSFKISKEFDQVALKDTMLLLIQLSTN